MSILIVRSGWLVGWLVGQKGFYGRGDLNWGNLYYGVNLDRRAPIPLAEITWKKVPWVVTSKIFMNAIKNLLGKF